MRIEGKILMLKGDCIGDFRYGMTLRDERVFNIGDNVFFTTYHGNGKALRAGVITGIERENGGQGNYEYRYKVSFNPTSHDKYPNSCCTFDNVKSLNNLSCAEIFESLSQAKKTAIRIAEIDYKTRLKEIANFFDNFNR